MMMTLSNIFEPAQLPPVAEQYYEIDRTERRLLVGPAVARSVVGVMVPFFRQKEAGTLSAGMRELLARLKERGEPLLWRDADTKTLGMNFTASVVTISALMGQLNALHGQADLEEKYAKVSTDLRVVRGGFRQLYKITTGHEIALGEDYSAARQSVQSGIGELDTSSLADEIGFKPVEWKRMIVGVRPQEDEAGSLPV